MEKINLDEEWSFIKDEVHKEKVTENNSLKRQLLFVLQILLSNNTHGINNTHYLKLKNKYLSF